MTTFAADLLPPKMPKRFSASFIGASTKCMLGARFDREAGIGGVFATVGSAAHEIFATCEFRAQLGGLSQIYPEQALEIADRVLNNPEEPRAMTHGMYRQVRQMAKTWAERITFPTDADTWVIEHPFRIPIYDYENDVVYIVSGRMDEYAIWGTHYRNRDWKTGPGLPKIQVVEEEHTQLPIYAIAAFREHPYLETFELEEFYTRRGIPRTVDITRDDIPELEGWLLERCRAIAKAYNDNDFEATPGERWCNTCAMPDKCPKPESVRLSSVITTEADAIAQQEVNIVLAARLKQGNGAVRGFLEGRGQMETIVVGNKEYGILPKRQSRLDDDRLNLALMKLGLTKDEFYVTEEGQEYGSRNVR